MDAKALIKDLREALDQFKKQGQTAVAIDGLEAYLKAIEPAADAANNHAVQQAARQRFADDMELWKLKSGYELAMFNSVIEAGLNALKSAIVINGGAAVALLAFIGGVLQQKGKGAIALSDVGFALLMFLFGTGCAGVASGVRYLSQFLYARSVERSHRGEVCEGKLYGIGGGIFNLVCILLGAVSYILFFYGGWHAYGAVTK